MHHAAENAGSGRSALRANFDGMDSLMPPAAWTRLR